MTTETPGRLTCDDGDSHCIGLFFDSDHDAVAYLSENARAGTGLQAEDHANARRLCASWNACRSVPLDVLESLDVGRLRDELLAGLGCLAFEIPSATWKQDVERHIRAALAALGETT